MIDKKYLVIVSLIYGYLVGAGYYGYSNDYYAEYYQSNLIYPNFYDKLGSILSTLTLFDIHFGVYFTSFFLALSSGLLLKSFFDEKKTHDLIIFYFIFLLMLHIHPIIMSTSGAMRQGWAMIFIFFSMQMILKNKNIFAFLFIFLAIFMHKSGLIFFTIYIVSILTLNVIQKMKRKRNVIVSLSLIGLLMFFLTCCSAYLIGWTSTEHKIVAGDFRFLWLIINLFYIGFYFLTIENNLSRKIKYLTLYLFIYSCCAPALLYMGLNWQYERLNMVIAILLILVIGLFLKIKNFHLYLSLAMCTYLFITIYQGMYSVGLT